MNQEKRYDFHVHTSYSYDSLTPPKTVVEVARRRGLDGIAVTDHERVEGALAAMEANRDAGFLVIPGIEIKTDIGDVIALYVTENVRSRRFDDVVEEIHQLGGIACLPHPLRTFGESRSRAIFAERRPLDLWERYNGRYDRRHYAQADRLFDELDIPGALSGSDAHFPWE
ncbi:MAG: PHP domain-containing protein, partial [Candidatus Eremiobacteraeota bacterium]|nr:PHP domain-containing protein [Candidatus Eremiobacteraeota bacterium]